MTKPACPISSVLDLIGAKWTIQILREVSLGPVRTRRFLRIIPGLSMKSLQERLKALQAAGIIRRIQYDEKLPHVEHEITDRGRRLFNVLLDLKAIGDEIAPVDCRCPIAGYSQSKMRCPYPK